MVWELGELVEHAVGDGSEPIDVVEDGRFPCGDGAMSKGEPYEYVGRRGAKAGQVMEAPGRHEVWGARAMRVLICDVELAWVLTCEGQSLGVYIVKNLAAGAICW